MKLKLIERGVKTRKASDIIHLETYTDEDRLIVAKPDGDKLMIGRVIEASALIAGGGDFGVTINSVIRSAPDNSVVQISLVGSPDFDAPDRYARGKTHGKRAVTELVQRHRAVLEGALQAGWQEEEPVLSTRRVLISLAVPVADTSEATLAEAAIKQADFLANVRRSGFRDADVLSASEVVGVYRWFFNIFKERVGVTLDELVDLRFQVFGPDQELDFRAPFVGRLAPDCYCAAVAIKSFPVEPRAGLMNIATGGIFRDRKATEGGGPKITTPFIYTTTVRVANQRAEGTRVQRAIDSRLNKSAPFTLGREDAERKLRDLKTIQQQCAEGEDKYVYVSTSAFVFGRTPGEARSSAGVVAGLLDKLKFDAREVVDNIGVRLAQALPLNYSLRVAEALDSEAIMSSSGCAMVLPLYGDYTGNVPLNSKETGWPLITRRGQLMSTDVWRAKSPHGVIVAQTGAGKSVVVQSKIKTHLASGTRVVVVESGRSLYKFCDAVGGDHIDPAINRPSLNGFSLLETEEDFVDQEELLTDLGMQMCYFNEEVVSGGRIAMGEAVKAAYANRGNRADYYTVVESLEAIVRGATGIDSDNEITTAARALVPRLKSFLDNPARGSFFRGQCAMDVNAQLTVFELDGLGESHLKKCVMSFIMNVVLSRLRLHPGRKVIMIEEAADILKDPNDAGVVGGIYRKGRKDLVAIWAVFQSLLQMLKLPAGELIFGQSYWKFLMHQDAAEIDKLVAGEKLGKFNNDAFYVQLLKSVDTIKPLYSEVLVQSGDTYEVGRLFLDRFTLGLFESEGASRERIFALMKDGMDVVEAVELVIGEGNSKRRRWVDDFVSELRDVQGLSPSEIRAAVQEALQ